MEPTSLHLADEPILTYEDALNFLDGLDVSAMKLGLSRIQNLMATLGNVQDSLPMVHVAGTNGKGSVTAMLASILRSAGYSVGTFTSPHLIHVRERIAINGNPILPDDFQELVADLKLHLEALRWPKDEWPTYFEFLNVLAYLYFKEKEVNLTLFEVGLGGRLDSTNVVKQPNLTVITGIAYDHMHFLGSTLTDIAAEKAGIIKAGVPLVLGPNLPEEAKVVICQQAAKLEAPLVESQEQHLAVLDGEQPVLKIQDNQAQQTYELSLLGPYQRENLATVLACVQQLRSQGYDISESAIDEGLRHTYWPARFQYFANQSVLLDGSHNSQGFESLRDGLQRYFAHRPLIWLISLRQNRNPQDLVDVISRFPQTQGVMITQGNPAHLYHGTEALRDVVQAALPGTVSVQVAETPTDAFFMLQQQLQGIAETRPLGVITGSLYTAGEILHTLERPAERSGSSARPR